jgi:DNA-binding MarR family transcriptional regulator
MARASSKSFAPNEFALMQAVADNPGQTQRAISARIGLSLGMTNILLMRLARKGYIKIRQLDWKRTEYLLTLKGAIEKSRKSYAYTLHTIRLFRQIITVVQEAVRREYAAGLREATVVAWPETAQAIREAVAELPLDGLRLRYVTTFKALGSRPGTVFIATEEPAPRPAADQKFVTLLDFRDLKFQYPD